MAAFQKRTRRDEHAWATPQSNTAPTPRRVQVENVLITPSHITFPNNLPIRSARPVESSDGTYFIRGPKRQRASRNQWRNPATLRTESGPNQVAAKVTPSHPSRDELAGGGLDERVVRTERELARLKKLQAEKLNNAATAAAATPVARAGMHSQETPTTCSVPMNKHVAATDAHGFAAPVQSVTICFHNDDVVKAIQDNSRISVQIPRVLLRNETRDLFTAPVVDPPKKKKKKKKVAQETRGQSPCRPTADEKAQKLAQKSAHTSQYAENLAGDGQVKQEMESNSSETRKERRRKKKQEKEERRRRKQERRETMEKKRALREAAAQQRPSSLELEVNSAEDLAGASSPEHEPVSVQLDEMNSECLQEPAAQPSDNPGALHSSRPTNDHRDRSHLIVPMSRARFTDLDEYSKREDVETVRKLLEARYEEEDDDDASSEIEAISTNDAVVQKPSVKGSFHESWAERIFGAKPGKTPSASSSCKSPRSQLHSLPEIHNLASGVIEHSPRVQATQQAEIQEAVRPTPWESVFEDADGESVASSEEQNSDHPLESVFENGDSEDDDSESVAASEAQNSDRPMELVFENGESEDNDSESVAASEESSDRPLESAQKKATNFIDVDRQSQEMFPLTNGRSDWHPINIESRQLREQSLSADRPPSRQPSKSQDFQSLTTLRPVADSGNKDTQLNQDTGRGHSSHGHPAQQAENDIDGHLKGEQYLQDTITELAESVLAPTVSECKRLKAQDPPENDHRGQTLTSGSSTGSAANMGITNIDGCERSGSASEGLGTGDSSPGTSDAEGNTVSLEDATSSEEDVDQDEGSPLSRCGSDRSSRSRSPTQYAYAAPNQIGTVNHPILLDLDPVPLSSPKPAPAKRKMTGLTSKHFSTSQRARSRRVKSDAPESVSKPLLRAATAPTDTPGAEAECKRVVKVDAANSSDLKRTQVTPTQNEHHRELSSYDLPEDSCRKRDEIATGGAVLTTPPKRKRKSTGKVSEHFTASRGDSNNTATSSKRVPAGTSTVPVPSINKSKFGLVQEECWRQPFWLLVAVNLLNKTNGQVAIPVFERLRELYPTPEDLASADHDEILGIIQHLGLQHQRTKTLLAMARIWVDSPPMVGKLYRRLHYPAHGDGKASEMASVIDTDMPVCKGAIEIGHIRGCGRYAYDSWRIFCRDVLRGVASDYEGSNAEQADFEPEWKRVLPQDKELRACLRWMWLRKGWIWDPLTGEKRDATNEEMEMATHGQMEIEDVQERKFAARAAGLKVSPQSRGNAIWDETDDSPAKSTSRGYKSEPEEDDTPRRSQSPRAAEQGKDKGFPSPGRDSPLVVVDVNEARRKPLLRFAKAHRSIEEDDDKNQSRAKRRRSTDRNRKSKTHSSADEETGSSSDDDDDDDEQTQRDMYNAESPTPTLKKDPRGKNRLASDDSEEYEPAPRRQRNKRTSAS